MKLGVIVLNWDAAEDTGSTLLMVRTWRDTSALQATTVWVVDNASRDADLEPLRSDHPDVRFVVSPVNRGYGGGNNVGVTAALEAGSEAVVLLNNDARMDGKSLGSMLDALRSDARIGVVGPVLRDGHPLLSVGGRDIAAHVHTHIRAREPPDRLRDVDYVPGTAALIARRTFETVGLLDEEFFFSGEMADFCLRARRAGLRCVIDPEARADHDRRRATPTRETLRAYYSVRNRFLYVRKHCPGRRAALYSLWSLRAGVAVAAALARGRRRRARAIALGIADGLGGRFGNRNERVIG